MKRASKSLSWNCLLRLLDDVKMEPHGRLSFRIVPCLSPKASLSFLMFEMQTTTPGLSRTQHGNSGSEERMIFGLRGRAGESCCIVAHSGDRMSDTEDT